jgi:cytoskeletal protein RodZ
VALESGQGNNRLFIILSIALIGLICIGLMGLSGVLFVVQQNREQDTAMLEPTSTATPFPPTFTPTSTFTPTPTDTPEPTPTGTMVVTTPDSAPISAQATGEEVEVSAADMTATAMAVQASETDTGQAAGEATPLPPQSTPDTAPNSGGVLTPTSQQPILWAAGLLLLILLAAGGLYWRNTRANFHS